MKPRGRRAQAETSDAETLGGTRYALHAVKRAVKVLHAVAVPQSAENIGAPVIGDVPARVKNALLKDGGKRKFRLPPSPLYKNFTKARRRI